MSDDEFQKLHRKVCTAYFASDDFKKAHPILFKRFARKRETKGEKVIQPTPEEFQAYREEHSRRWLGAL